MAKTVLYVGETVSGQLINGRPYSVEGEAMDFKWLKTETGGILRVEPQDIKEPMGGLGAESSGVGKGLQYGKPKPKVTVPEETIDKTIANNEIYRRVRAALNSPQREQVGYGIQKYPEPLNADTWTILETIGHIKGELIDALHYLTMLEIKFEMMGEKDLQK